jgi:precorrin-6B methylase 2
LIMPNKAKKSVDHDDKNVKPLTPEKIMQLGMAFRDSKALLSAVELGLFSELASAGPLDTDALRERLGLHERASTDFFDALVALGMLEREDGLYRNTAATDMFLDRAKPFYMGGVLELANTTLYDNWGSLTESLLTGIPQSEAKSGKDLFEVLYTDPTRTEQFVRGMAGASKYIGTVIASKFSWRDYQSVIDIGCSGGAVPIELALAHDHLTGGGFDLPALESIFNSNVAEFGLSERLRYTAGDFFTDPLPQADVLIMGHLLHGFNLAKRHLLLEKAYSALPEDGALIIYDAIIDDERRNNSAGLITSLLMPLQTTEGFESTGSDYRGWMKEAGFRKVYVEHLVGPNSMVVGIK